MRVAHKIKRLLGNLLWRHRVEGTLDDELRAYVDELTDRNIVKGMPREEARRQALLEAGGIEQIKEEVRGHGSETESRPLSRTFDMRAARCGVGPGLPLWWWRRWRWALASVSRCSA